MGRWLIKRLVEEGHKVWILDNLSNGSKRNVDEFEDKVSGFIIADIQDRKQLSKAFETGFDICFHLAASINVQASIEDPRNCFDNNVKGTFNILEECKTHRTKVVFVSSALIYETAKDSRKIRECHFLNPSCPYTVSKIFGENLVLSYYKTYGLPAVILRPFSIYGPWQRSDAEGGVMSIFIQRKLKSMPIEIFGDGRQGRDFFYIEDCVEFIVKAAFCERAVGEIFNAGSGSETKISTLAKLIADDKIGIKFVKHPHPYAEVINMCADSTKAKRLLGWVPRITLEEGIHRTTEWLKKTQ